MEMTKRMNEYASDISTMADEIRKTANKLEDTITTRDLYELISNLLEAMENMRSDADEISQLATDILRENLRGEKVD